MISLSSWSKTVFWNLWKTGWLELFTKMKTRCFNFIGSRTKDKENKSATLNKGSISFSMKCKTFNEKEWETSLKTTTIFRPLSKKICHLSIKIYGALKAPINTNLRFSHALNIRMVQNFPRIYGSLKDSAGSSTLKFAYYWTLVQNLVPKGFYDI